MSIVSDLVISRRHSLAFILVGGFWGTYAALVPVIQNRLDVADATFGLLLLCSGIGVIFAIWFAPLCDSILRERSIQITALVFAFVVLLPEFASSAFNFGIIMLLLGISSGVLDVLINARVSELEGESKRSLMNANHGVFH
jgi:predicted MFS family arabinose efflux permease